jgi:four helix bundle protein
MDHKELDVWKKSYQINLIIHEILKSFPENEKFVLISQISRSAISIPSNIAEGAARNSDKEFIHFLYISLGSLAELETQLLLAKDFMYHNNEEIFLELKICKKLILGLISYLKKK